jgi:hypothetical protein
MLSKAAREFFERLYHERFCALREAYDAECRRLEWTANHVEKFNLYEKELKQFLKALLQTRVQAFMETFQKIDQFPDDSDLQDLAKDLALRAGSAINGFPLDFFKGPICSIPLNLVNSRVRTLTAELRQLPTAAIAPAQRLVAEGRLIASQTPNRRR